LRRLFGFVGFLERIAWPRYSLQGFEQSTSKPLFSDFFDFFLYQGSNG